MNRIVTYTSIAIFSIFLGSQITEGFLLVPYWKSLSKIAFFEYYAKFGPIIGRFYTILTSIAVVMPLSISIYCFVKKSRALKFSIVSTFFAFLIIVIFYIYFNDTNQKFYEATFDANSLKSELVTWECMHWIRVFLEVLSLVFLMLSMYILSIKSNQ